MARAYTFTAEQQESLLDWVASGRTIRSWCREEGNCAPRAVYYWIEADPANEERLVRAKAIGHEMIAEECLEIADTPTTMRDDVSHRKLQIWTRLQLLAKWSPKYGALFPSERAAAQVVIHTGVPQYGE